MHEEKELMENSSEILEDQALFTEEVVEAEHHEELHALEESVESEESVETQELVPQPEKVDKYHKAKKLVEEAKGIIATSDHELEDCRVLLENDLHEYQAAKSTLETDSLNQSKALLTQLGYTENFEDEEASDIIFEAKKDIKPVVIKEINSGKFTGFILALIGGLATFIGLLYLATEKLGIMLDVTKVPSNKTIQTILGWFGTQVGKPDDFVNGGLVVVVIVLVMMVVLYLLRVWLKEGANLRFAEEQMKETQKYITQKNNCKMEMDMVDAHIIDAISTLKDYSVVLNEQNGKLQRILHFEGEHTDIDTYHPKSKKVMEETEEIVGKIINFITTPMSQEGKLSEKSTLFLNNAKAFMQAYLAKLK